MASKLTVEQFAAEVSRALGDRLVALLLYGSWARGTHVPDRSDVNTLLICDTVDDALFAALAPAMRAWTRAGHPAPLILTEREWRESADAFPIEYEDMRDAHRLLAGLRLAGRPVPASPAELVRSAAALAGFPTDALAPLVQHAMGGRIPRLGKGDPLAAAYLAAVASTAAYVNRLE